MRALLVVLTAAVCFGAGSARADDLLDYGRVVCVDDEIILQFARLEVSEAPVFAPLPDGRNFDVPPARAATCGGSAQGRVRLMQGYLDDATAFGANMGWSTPVFTLRIGDRIAFRRFSIRVRGEFSERDLRSIVIRGDTATLCRADGGCSTQQIAFTSDEELRHIDTLTVAPVRERDRALCESFVRSEERSWLLGEAASVWPTYLHDPRDTIAGDNWNGYFNEAPERFDLNNDGREDAPIEGSGFGGRGSNYSFWALPPRDLSEAERNEVAVNLSRGWVLDEALPTMRREGWVVYTGAETRFGEILWVYISVLMRGDEAYLLASRRQDPMDVLLRVTPNGRMREVCVYERAPDL